MTAVRHTIITSAEIITLIYFVRVYAVRTQAVQMHAKRYFHRGDCDLRASFGEF